MIIRESPTPTPTKPKPDINWPPKSPHEVLLVSPGGRKRLQQTVDRNSISPSPSKRPRPGSLHDATPARSSDMEDEEEEDEETLQLQLKAIEARLKLKKIQKAKTRGDALGIDRDTTIDSSAISREQTSFGSRRPGHHHSFTTIPNVQVPLSPTRAPRLARSPESPRRVALGIDKGLRAADVSLKKACSRRMEHVSPHKSQSVVKNFSKAVPEKTKSFSERMAESRSQDMERKQMQERIDRGRSKGFGVCQNSKEVNNRAPNKHIGSRNTHGDIHDVTGNEQKAQSQQSFEKLPANSSKPVSRDTDKPPQKHQLKVSQARAPERAPEHEFRKPFNTSEDFSELETYTGFNLSKRLLNHSTLTDAFAGKTILSIPQLLKTVTAPDYEPPNIESDYVVVGVIASKSSPRAHAPNHKTTSTSDPDDAENSRSKFMVLSLTDLEWEFNLFLFDTGFESFWKLTLGTVIAVLNPGIMPPKPHLRDTGQFSLKLSSSEDTVLEIGTAKDLGFCKSVKKDGKECGQWVDARKTEFCDFHVNLKVEKAKAARMEINTMGTLGLFGSQTKGNRGGRSGGGGRSGPGNARWKDDGLAKEGRYYDHSSHETAYCIPKEFSRIQSTAALLDAEDYIHGGLSKAERARKRRAEQEKERDLAKQLGAHGGGLGSEYMRHKQHDGSVARGGTENRSGREDPVDAATLGLLGGRSSAVTLSPVKGGKFGPQSVKSQAVGWAGAFKRGLASPERSPTRGARVVGKGEGAPPVKKARFMLEKKGLRVPGRESLPGASGGVVGLDDDDDDDDDDDLDIV